MFPVVENTGYTPQSLRDS